MEFLPNSEFEDATLTRRALREPLLFVVDGDVAIGELRVRSSSLDGNTGEMCSCWLVLMLVLLLFGDGWRWWEMTAAGDEYEGARGGRGEEVDVDDWGCPCCSSLIKLLSNTGLSRGMSSMSDSAGELLPLLRAAREAEWAC